MSRSDPLNKLDFNLENSGHETDAYLKQNNNLKSIQLHAQLISLI